MMSVFVIIYMVNCRRAVFLQSLINLADMIQFSTQYKGIQNTLLKELAIPYAILMADGRILWKNDSFEELFVDQKWEKYMNKLIPKLNLRCISKAEYGTSGITSTVQGTRLSSDT